MGARGKQLIYLVDDDDDDQYLIGKALLAQDASQNMTPDLTCFSGGHACLEHLFVLLCTGDSLPDLILLDLNMPKMDGKEVLDKIKSNISLQNIPVVIYTTSSSEIDTRDVYALGANACIFKPGSFAELVGVMQRMCDFWLR